jgi:hypothetical protein
LIQVHPGDVPIFQRSQHCLVTDLIVQWEGAHTFIATNGYELIPKQIFTVKPS